MLLFGFVSRSPSFHPPPLGERFGEDFEEIALRHKTYSASQVDAFGFENQTVIVQQGCGTHFDGKRLMRLVMLLGQFRLNAQRRGPKEKSDEDTRPRINNWQFYFMP